MGTSEPLLPGTDTLPGADTLPVEGHIWPGQAAAEARGQVHLVDGRGFALRHVRPGAGEGAATVDVLGTALGFEWLPMSTLPTSPDLVEGSYTGRLGDSGEFTLRFPNATSSKGLWREKFNEDGAKEWIEIYRDGELEFVGVIQRIEITRSTVTVSGGDGWELLKRAYERDRVWNHAPADVIDHSTHVRVPFWREAWEAPPNNKVWAWAGGDGTTTLQRAPNGGQGVLTMDLGNTDTWATGFPEGLGDHWELETVIQETARANSLPIITLIVGGADGYHAGVRLEVHESDANKSRVYLYARQMDKAAGAVQVHAASVPAWVVPKPAPPAGGGVPPPPGGEAMPPGAGSGALDGVPAAAVIKMRRSGEWFSVEINGWRGFSLRLPEGLTTNTIAIVAERSGIWRPGNPQEWVIWPITVTRLRPFLRRGATRGDRKLPGDAPHGGLRGHYFNTAPLQARNTHQRLQRVMAPEDEPYGHRVDPTIDFLGGSGLPLLPGASSDGSWYAVRWTGAVWLPDATYVDFLLDGVDDGARLWVADTTGPPLLDGWRDAAGTVGPGRVTPQGAGWYPIRLEYFQGAVSHGLRLRYGNNVGWTDPGGAVIPAGNYYVVPATSLSPLGCHEGRVQGQSHFQIVQDAAAQAGYQLLLEPMSLESGEFPGRLIPRLRVGRDTDVILEVDDADAAEPIMEPSVTRDAAEQTTRLIGAGAGTADGRGSQTMVEVADHAAGALFDLESWVDAGDASLPQLLEARANAELALRNTPWEEVRGTPRALERLADTWPLTGTLAAMRWRPGDGLRVAVPDIGVLDRECRQITQVTRQFAAEGRTATQVAWRQRPRSAAASLRRLALSQALGQRSYQSKHETLTSNYVSTVVAAGAMTDYGILPLQPQDRVVRAVVRVSLNPGGGTLGAEINGILRTTDLGGGWTTVPLEIDITAYATQATSTDNRLYVRLSRTGGTSASLQFQVIVAVLR